MLLTRFTRRVRAILEALELCGQLAGSCHFWHIRRTRLGKSCQDLAAFIHHAGQVATNGMNSAIEQGARHRIRGVGFGRSFPAGRPAAKTAVTGPVPPLPLAKSGEGSSRPVGLSAGSCRSQPGRRHEKFKAAHKTLQISLFLPSLYGLQWRVRRELRILQTIWKRWAFWLCQPCMPKCNVSLNTQLNL